MLILPPPSIIVNHIFTRQKLTFSFLLIPLMNHYNNLPGWPLNHFE